MCPLSDLKEHSTPFTNYIFICSSIFFFFLLPHLSPLLTSFPTLKYLNNSGLKFFYWNKREDGWKDGWMERRMDGQMDEWKDRHMDEQLDGGMDVQIDDGWIDG